MTTYCLWASSFSFLHSLSFFSFSLVFSVFPFSLSSSTDHPSHPVILLIIVVFFVAIVVVVVVTIIIIIVITAGALVSTRMAMWRRRFSMESTLSVRLSDCHSIGLTLSESRRCERVFLQNFIFLLDDRQGTMGQNQVILRHQKFTFPRARE